MVDDNSETVEKMLQNHSGERVPSGLKQQSTQSAVESLSVSETEPEYVHGRDNFEDVAVAWCEWAIEAYDLPIDRSDIEIKADGRLTSAFGNCRARGGKPIMKITRKYDRFVEGWDRAKETLLHELIHCVQAVWLGWTSHGPTFKQGCRAVGLEEHANRQQYAREGPPQYIMECRECGLTDTKLRMCKTIRNAEKYGCKCGASAPTWESRRNTGEHKELLEYWNKRLE